MKLRDDFVSNSSSTSFIVAINKEYNTFDFCKDVAKACVNKKYEYHNKDLQKINEVNLAYCLLHYELLHLGNFLVRTTKTTIQKDKLPVTLENGYEFTEEEWKYHEKEIKEWEKIKDHPEDPDYQWREEYRDNCIKDETLYLYTRRWFGGIALDLQNDYDYHVFDRSGWFEDLVDSGKASPEQLKMYESDKINRVERLKELAEKYTSKNEECEPTYDSYSITMSTIKNTKDLLAAGVDLKFDKWENLERIEKRLLAGEKIFMIRNNHSGDGYLSDGVFSEDGSPMLECKSNLAMECLHSECG